MYWIALDRVCRLTRDVAHWHGQQGKAQILPVRCCYSLSAARVRMQEWNAVDAVEARSRDVQCLLYTEEIFREMRVF